MHLTTRIFLLRMVHEIMPIARQCPIATGRVGIEPTARLNGDVGCLLYGPDGKIPDRLHHDGSLAADPRDDRWPVFVIMPPARLALLAATPWSASQQLFPTVLRLALVPSRVIEFIRFDSAFQ